MRFERISRLTFVISILAFIVALANSSLVLALLSAIVATLFFLKSWLEKLKELWCKVPKKWQSLLEWGGATFLAILLLQNILFFIFELYTIPSSSMEPVLKKGDMVLVNKIWIGNRFLPNSMNTFFRLGGVGEINRGDAIVFNFPEGDSVYIDLNRDNYLYLNRLGSSEELNSYKKRYKPVYNRSRYLKRVIALPSDTFSLRNGNVFINGVAQNLDIKTIRSFEFDSVKDAHIIERLGTSIVLRENGKAYANLSYPNDNTIIIDGKPIEPFVINAAIPDRLIFPFTTSMYYFNRDNIGSVVVPKKGTTVQLTSYTVPFYRRVISVYEGQKLTERDGRYFISGKEVREYTFKQDYYWVMGDNREHSYDSRYFGFVPDNHIIGVATRIVLSKDYDKHFFTIPQFDSFLRPL